MIEEELAKLKKKIETLNTQKIETATRLKALEEEKATLLAECQSLGVDPQALEQTVASEEASLQADIAKFAEDVEKVNVELRKF